MVLEGDSLCGMLRSGEQPPGRGPPGGLPRSLCSEGSRHSVTCQSPHQKPRCWHLPENRGEQVSAVTCEPSCPAHTLSAVFITQLGQTDTNPWIVHTVPSGLHPGNGLHSHLLSLSEL